MTPTTVFGIFLLIRLISVFVVSSWYVPDEYWQSLEVAHKFTYGYGYLTWEWAAGIRSYLYPIFISALYKIISLLRLDSPATLIVLPRIFQAVLSAYSDLCFWKWCGKSRWSIFCAATSWFWFYTGSRTLINTVETSLSAIALSQFPFQKLQNYKSNNSTIFMWLVGLLFAIRPTSAIVWLPLCSYHLLVLNKEELYIAVLKYLSIGFVILLISCGIDSWAHGSLIFTWWEFLKVNVLYGIGEFYGSQPWHWYLSQGFPAVLGIQLLPFILASIQVLVYRTIYIDELVMLGTIAFTITVYSFLGHKEFRFLLPLLPISLHLTSQYLSNWSRKANDMLVWVVAGTILMANFVPAYYLSQYHQRGTLDVMVPLRQIAAADPSNTQILFLMPCHSTPLYSHLHQNVSVRFLTCNPNLSGTDNYVDEADSFYQSPSFWIRNNFPSDKKLPSHIVAFDCLVPYLSDILSRYKPTHRIFHANINSGDSRVGRYVTVHERVDV